MQLLLILNSLLNISERLQVLLQVGNWEMGRVWASHLKKKKKSQKESNHQVLFSCKTIFGGSFPSFPKMPVLSFFFFFLQTTEGKGNA